MDLRTKRNRLLQQIAFGTGDPHFITLNAGLHLQLGVFDDADNFLASSVSMPVSPSPPA